MDKREYKLEKLKARIEQERYYMGELTQLLKNPLVEYILGLMLIGYLTRGERSLLERLTGADVMAGAMGVGLTGVITAQQLSASLPYIVQMTDKAAPLIGGLLK
jgi:hypothetical protein